jgi:sugar phosphate isomerase/epimerase
MRLDWLPGEPQLTYCTNIHAGESLPDITASLDAHVPAIKAAVSPEAPFGVGLRLSAIAAASLIEPATGESFREQLARLGAYVFTLNAFPYGPFHGTRVKEHVYEPDWRTDERVRFTKDAATILADLLPEGGYGSISTVPGAFKPSSAAPRAVAEISERLARIAADLVRLERQTGRTIALALEPEPFCFLETVDETLAFFEDRLFAREAVARFATSVGLGTEEAETALRRHLGVCYDVCHGAVEFEDPVTALRTLIRAGIAVPKIQLSAAMRVPRMASDRLAQLSRFDTGVYLHQVVVQNGHLRRFVDLPDAFRAYERGEADGEWRIHCHVPVFLSTLGELGSTQDTLVALLRALKAESLSPHLEVETYTWDVLPPHLKTRSKAHDIARELEFVLQELSP